MKCGTHTKELRPQEEPCYTPDVCPHLVTDHRGSTRSTHKVWCKQCNTYILEEPQELHKERVKASKAEYDKGRKQRQAESRPYDDLILEESEATGLAKAFAKSVVSYFAKHPQAKEEGVTVKHLHSMLDDLVDMRLVEKEESKGYDRGSGLRVAIGGRRADGLHGHSGEGGGSFALDNREPGRSARKGKHLRGPEGVRCPR